VVCISPTIIVTPRVLLRAGIASLLQNTRYKVVASAAKPAELSSSCCPKGQQSLAIVGIDHLQNGNLDKVAETIRPLRSLLPDGKVVLVAETDGRIDPQRVLAFSADAFILNLGSRDVLIKILELAFMDQRVIALSDTRWPRPPVTQARRPLATIMMSLTLPGVHRPPTLIRGQTATRRCPHAKAKFSSL
jgi:DNA-binding NarL/FixJ family response regulator